MIYFTDLDRVKVNSSMLKYVEEQTEEICLEAVKKDGLVLQYVKNQTNKVCLEAVKKNGWALKYVREQNLELCKLAIYHNYFIPYSYFNNYSCEDYGFENINFKKPRLCLQIIKTCNNGFKYINKQYILNLLL